jgi:hypothetical protein
MPRIQDREKEKQTSIFPVYTAKEFFPLEAELESYKIDIPTYPGNNGVAYMGNEGLWKYYFDNGALSKRRYMNGWTVSDIDKFKEVQNKLDQFNNWLRRKEYAIKMQGKDYDTLVDQIDLNLPVDDIPF